MAAQDWSQCAVVESIPGKVSEAWVFKGIHTPVAVVFENLGRRIAVVVLGRVVGGLIRLLSAGCGVF
jgi:hypothetical protein